MRVKFVRMFGDTRGPKQQKYGDAGSDLPCAEAVMLEPGERKPIRTGLVAIIPDGWWLRIVGRSSSLWKRGLMVHEATIDQGFRGELFVYVTNVGHTTQDISVGDRLAQAILLPVVEVEWVETDKVDATDRGDNGFGSTGR